MVRKVATLTYKISFLWLIIKELGMIIFHHEWKDVKLDEEIDWLEAEVDLFVFIFYVEVAEDGILFEDEGWNDMAL